MVSGRPNLVYSPGPGLWSLVLGPFGPDLGPGPELDNKYFLGFGIMCRETQTIKFSLCMDSSYFRQKMNTTQAEYLTNTCLEAEYNYDTIR